MANYAYNNITFIVPAEEKDIIDLEFLVTNINYLFSNVSTQTNEITQAISKAYEKPIYIFDRRDNFCWICDDGVCYNEDYNEYTFDISIESAWSPVISRITEWVQSIYPNVSVLGVCEEPGFEVYINTDEDGKYYQVRYKIWMGTKDGDSYDYECNDISDVLEILKPYIEFDQEPKCLSEIQNKIDEYLESDEMINNIESIEVYEYDLEDSCTFADMEEFIPQPKN